MIKTVGMNENKVYINNRQMSLWKFKIRMQKIFIHNRKMIYIKVRRCIRRMLSFLLHGVCRVRCCGNIGACHREIVNSNFEL